MRIDPYNELSSLWFQDDNISKMLHIKDQEDDYGNDVDIGRTW